MDLSEEACPLPSKRLLIFFGLTASGKSTVAERYALAKMLPYYNTDRERKILAGLSPTARRPDGIDQGIYTAELTAKTYGTMLAKAFADFNEGHSQVVLDGSYGADRERAELLAAAHREQVEPIFIFCFCSEAEVKRRLLLRAQDKDAVSDGRWEIYQYQLKNFVSPDLISQATVIKLDTEKELQALDRCLEQMLAGVD